MLLPSTSLKFMVRRHPPELIAPSLPTPHELMPLSDIDDQKWLRYHMPVIHIYKMDPKLGDTNPVSMIRDALAKVLVFYYPFAGRLKEGPASKLMVDCTGEGVLFTEAEANVTLEQFGKVVHPPFPCMEELLYDVPGSSGIINSPLLLFQVTRLLCGGFIIASRVNHTMTDGAGFKQFLSALSEIARGASAPSIHPVWQRELLFARDTPRITFHHREYDDVTNTKLTSMTSTRDKMNEKTFFFGLTELSAIRKCVPENLKGSSTFEMLAAFLWRCRTIALEPDLEEEMRFMFPFNARTMFNPSLPVGYYGNCIVEPCAITKARDLMHKPLGHALELVMKAKALVCEEYVRSTADLLVLMRARPNSYSNLSATYEIVNVSRLGLDQIDFGWGKPAYGGPVAGGVELFPALSSFYMFSTNEEGESGIMVSMCLPSTTMEKFVKELNKILMKACI